MLQGYLNTSQSTNRVYTTLLILWVLIRRDFLGRYRRSILGPLWAILQPTAYMVIFLFLRSIIDAGDVDGPYAVFSYVALVPWTFFVNTASKSAPSIYGNAGIVKKMPLRKEVFPCAAVMSSLMDFVLASVVLAGLFIWYRESLSVGLAAFWALPILALLILFAMGMGFIFSALGTYKHDVAYATPFLMQFWMLATPIIYPLDRVPGEWQTLYALNPMVGIIEGFRSAVMYNRTPDMELLLAAGGGTALVWLIGWPLFRYMSQYFADVL